MLYRFLHLLQARPGGIFSLLKFTCVGESHGRPRVNAARSLVFFATTPTLLLLLLLQLPMMRQKSSSLIVVFTWLHDSKIRSSATFYFRKTADVGWDGIQSPISSHLLKRKMEVYIQNYDENKSTKYIAWMPNFCKCIKCIGSVNFLSATIGPEEKQTK